MQQSPMIDLGDALDEGIEGVFRSDGCPVPGKENHVDRRDEFLEGPPPSKPPTLAEAGTLGLMTVSGRDVGEIRVANVCKAVPFVHGVDGLRKLGATRFIDTA